MTHARRRLTEIANDCGTDKGTVHGHGHGYTLVYETLLAPYRDRAFNLLEIGLSMGGPELDQPASRSVTDAPSVRMWREYFPEAHIYGLDISDFSAFQSDWFTFFQADCGKVEQLERVAESGMTFDVIIDDGSHASFHQQLTLCTLFKSLKSGGLYIIEDLGWVPATYQRELPQVPRTHVLLGSFVANGSFTNTGGIPLSRWEAVAAQTGSILFFDEDTLVDGRHLFNICAGTKPHMPHYLEFSRWKRLRQRGYLRRIKEQARAVIRAIRSDVQPPRQARTKLAVIQKI